MKILISGLAVVAIGSCIALRSADGDGQERGPKVSACATPVLSPSLLEHRNALYGDLALGTALHRLGKLGASLEGASLEDDGASALRDILEYDANRKRLGTRSEYWVALAGLRTQTGDPVGATLAARHLIELGSSDARASYVGWRILDELGERAPSRASGSAVLGVILELCVTNGYTFVGTFADGTVELVPHCNTTSLDDGQTATQVRALVREASKIATKLKHGSGRPLPKVGEALFTLLTPRGPRVLRTRMSDLIAEHGDMAPLFGAANRLIATVTSKPAR